MYVMAEKNPQSRSSICANMEFIWSCWPGVQEFTYLRVVFREIGRWIGKASAVSWTLRRNVVVKRELSFLGPTTRWRDYISQHIWPGNTSGFLRSSWRAWLGRRASGLLCFVDTSTWLMLKDTLENLGTPPTWEYGGVFTFAAFFCVEFVV